MRTVLLGPSPSPSSASINPPTPPLHRLSSSPPRVRVSRTSSGEKSLGICKASQAVDLFPSICPEIVVRDARLKDCWEVADTHFPPGCMRTCLVAVTGTSVKDNLDIGSEDLKVGGFEGKVSFNRGSVAGILTVDTMADFLPRKGPFRQRRTGIAYISNVAVRDTDRRRELPNC